MHKRVKTTELLMNCTFNTCNVMIERLPMKGKKKLQLDRETGNLMEYLICVLTLHEAVPVVSVF